MVMQADLKEKSKSDLSKLQRLPIVNTCRSDSKISEREEKHLREIGEYEFMNIEEPGLMQKFTYGDTRNKETFTLFHGGKYKVPRFIARHIESRSKPIWAWRPDGTGSMRKEQTGVNSRFQMREVF